MNRRYEVVASRTPVTVGALLRAAVNDDLAGLMLAVNALDGLELRYAVTLLAAMVPEFAFSSWDAEGFARFLDGTGSLEVGGG